MSRLISSFPAALGLLAFASCHTVSPLVAPVDRQHPASPEAPEARMRPRTVTLAPDAATRRTRALLDQRAAEAAAEEREAPGDQTNIAPAKSPSPDHEHYRQ